MSDLCTKTEMLKLWRLVTFEPLKVEQSYIPLLKALMYGISASGAQGRDSTLSICHALLKNALLLSEIAKRPTFIFGNCMYCIDFILNCRILGRDCNTELFQHHYYSGNHDDMVVSQSKDAIIYVTVSQSKPLFPPSRLCVHPAFGVWRHTSAFHPINSSNSCRRITRCH